MWPVVDLKPKRYYGHDKRSLILEPPSGRFHAVLTPEAAAARVPRGGSIGAARARPLLPFRPPGAAGWRRLRLWARPGPRGGLIFPQGQDGNPQGRPRRHRHHFPRGLPRPRPAYAELAIGLKRGENYNMYSAAMADHAPLHLARSHTKTSYGAAEPRPGVRRALSRVR